MKALINDIKMAYDDLGNGPAVLLLHGFPFSRKMWQPQLETLAKNGFRVVAPDLRGFGETPSGDKPFAIKTHTDDVIKLMNYLGIGRAVVVTALNGEDLARDMNQRYAQRVTAGCFISPQLEPADIAEQVHLQDLAELIREGQHHTAIDILCDKYLPEHKSLHLQQQANEVRTWMEAADQKSLAGWLTYLLAATQKKTAESNPTHTLVLLGEKMQRHNNSNSWLQNAITQTINGAGHLVNLDKTGIVNSSLLDFLNWLNRNRTGHPALFMAA